MNFLYPLMVSLSNHEFRMSDRKPLTLKTLDVMRNSRGQLLIPSIMIFPALITFAILITELAKLSQQKILHQFAMDTAVAMEASMASDLANRIAYLNAPWPERSNFEQFNEEIEYTSIDPNNPGPPGQQPTWYELFKRNAVFPTAKQAQGFWYGRFEANPDDQSDGASNIEQRKSMNTPTPPDVLPMIQMTTYDQCNKYKPSYDDLWTSRFKIAYSIYGYLYQLSQMVENVYTSLNGVFFKRTFYLNSGFEPPDDSAPPKLHVKQHFVKEFNYWGVKLWGGASGSTGNCDEVRESERKLPDPGMWQLGTIEELRDREPEYELNFAPYYYQGPPNTFGLDYKELFDGEQPKVVASAIIRGGQIWPDPTPKFQVVLRP